MRRCIWIALALLLLSSACSPTPIAPAPTVGAIAPTRAATLAAAPTLPPPSATPTLRPTRVVPSPTPQPTATTTPTPLPTLQLDDQTIAWLWLPKPEDHYDGSWFLWKIGVPQDVAPGDIVAINGRGAQQTMGSNVVNVYDRPSGSPLFAQPIAPTNHIGIIDPVTKRVVSAQYAGDVLSPDAKRTASFVNMPSAPNQMLGATAITNVTTGMSRTFDVFDYYTLRFERRLHTWGTHTVYGSTHDRWMHNFWWFNPDQPEPEFGGIDGGTSFAVNHWMDRLVYTSFPDETSSELPNAAQLMVKNTFTGTEYTLDKDYNFYDLSISNNGRYVTCVYKSEENAIPELRLYDLSTKTYKLLATNINPDSTIENLGPGNGFLVPTSIYSWSNDSKYVLMLSADNDKSVTIITADSVAGDNIVDINNITLPYTRHALVFRASDGAQVGDVALPNFVGSLRLTNDLKIIMVVYDHDQASLVVRDVRTNAQSQPVALGRNTPLIVYVPEVGETMTR